MAGRLVCWRCGERVRDMDRPIRRLTRCHACGADLHVCRMCRYRDPRYIGGCDHDFAEPPVEKDVGNFCQFYKPRPDAYAPETLRENEAAKEHLESLFGGGGDEGSKDDPPTGFEGLFGEADGYGADDPRARLEALFTGGRDDESGDGSGRG